MEHRDYLKRQLDRFTRALAKLLGDLYGLKHEGKDVDFDQTTTELNGILGVDTHELLAATNDDLIRTLINKGLSEESLENLADIFVVAADNTRLGEARLRIVYERSYAIYSYLQGKDRIFSLERHQKMQGLKSLLETT